MAKAFIEFDKNNSEERKALDIFINVPYEERVSFLTKLILNYNSNENKNNISYDKNNIDNILDLLVNSGALDKLINARVSEKINKINKELDIIKSKAISSGADVSENIDNINIIQSSSGGDELSIEDEEMLAGFL